MITLEKLSISKVHESLSKGEFTVLELVQAYLDRIAKKDSTIHAYLELFNDVTLQASVAQEKFKNGTATLLTGIPFAIKDNILIKGKQVTAASKILEGYMATYDATVITKLKNEGAIFLGRANMDEFAMGSSTETSAYGITRNPIDETRVPGGSSGGSAAAVAMNGALVSLGSETCGSIRQPASFCGLVGLKPTYGAVSRHGVIAMGSSLDQISPIGKTVSDVETVFNVIQGHDTLDSTSVPNENRKGKLKEIKKIGVPVECFESDGIDPEVLASFKHSIDTLRGAGYEIVELAMPSLSYSLAVYYILMPAEVSTNLSRFDGMRYGLRKKGDTLFDVYSNTRGEGFGREARRRILLGTYILSHGHYDAYYNKAIQVREHVTREVLNAFSQVDAIATPTTPSPAFKIGEKISDPVAMYLSDIFAAPANLSGCPAIALPSGVSKDGLPLSIQFMAPHWEEKALFELGSKFEGLV